MKVLAAVTLFASLLVAALAEDGDYAPDLETVDYADGGYALQGFVAIPDTIPAPAVVIIPDNTNVDDYEMKRAEMIMKQFGWVGFAADVYGAEFIGVENRTILREQAGIVRSNDTLFYSRIQAAVDAAKSHPAVDPTKIAVIGYCFGGTGVLTYSFLGATDVVGAVSFHGGLTDFPVTGPINHPVLVLSGGADDTGTEIEVLENTLNEANATWQITRYSGIEHAFTRFGDRRYNQLADERSWREMATFLMERFGELSYNYTGPEMTMVEAVEYDDDDFNLTGYLAIPDSAETGATPAVVILPGWAGTGGPDGYPAQRATLLADLGYVGFVADIYGSEVGPMVEGFGDRIELATFYRTNYTYFVSRIKTAVDLVAAHELVNPEEIFVIGYCFGGTGAVDYAFSGLDNVKAVVPFHGGLTSTSPIETDVIHPYVLVQSGGIDDAHGNATELEMAFDSVNSTWEISRYSNVGHGFTEWESDDYNSMADWRSWDAMLDVFDIILFAQDMDMAEKATDTVGVAANETLSEVDTPVEESADPDEMFDTVVSAQEENP